MKRWIIPIVILTIAIIIIAATPNCPGGNCPTPEGTEPPPIFTEVRNPPSHVETPHPPQVNHPEKEDKVIKLPKSGYGPQDTQRNTLLGSLLIVSVLALFVIMLIGLVKR